MFELHNVIYFGYHLIPNLTIYSEYGNNLCHMVIYYIVTM